MQNIKVKVVGYEASNQSLLVKFGFDGAKKPIDEYPTLAFQPSTMGVSPAEALRKIAQTGLSVVEAIAAQEAHQNPEAFQSELEAMVGQEVSFDIAELRAEVSTTVQVDPVVIA